MYSLVYEGEVLDYRFKKIDDFTYSFYTGDIFQGQIFKLKSGWASVANKAVIGIRNVSGFHTRLNAAEYILRANGYKTS